MKKKELYIMADSTGVHFSEDPESGYHGHIHYDRRISIDKNRTFCIDNLNMIYKIADHGNMFQSEDKKQLALCPLNQKPGTGSSEQYSIESIEGKNYLCYGSKVISEKTVLP